jgi:uncharacterized membrane protein
MKSIEVWVMILFICQIALLIANPSEFWVKWIPVEVVLCVLMFFGLFAIWLFIWHMVRGFRKEMRRKREMLTIPEKE